MFLSLTTTIFAKIMWTLIVLQILMLRSWTLDHKNWCLEDLTFSIFAEILIMICKLFYSSVIICFATWLLSHDQHIIVYVIFTKIEVTKFKTSILQHDCHSWSRYNSSCVSLILLIYKCCKCALYHLRNFWS